MRRSRDAAVDTAGADALKDSSAGSPSEVRFQVRGEPEQTAPVHGYTTSCYIDQYTISTVSGVKKSHLAGVLFS